MGLAVYIPKSLFGPLPEWMVPWAVAGCVLAFVYVAIWAIRERMHDPVHFAPDGQGTIKRGGRATRQSLVLVAVLAVVVFLLWFLDPLGPN